MKKINALHIASFNGNIGDNANHSGLRTKLTEMLGGWIAFQEIEMREFYHSWNLRDFNSDAFIRLCNSYDLIIIGGGNFFELKWDYSYTGTTVNLNEETISKIKTPILFFGLGCDTDKGCNESTVLKFRKFLDIITNSDQFIVTVRNDGSYETLQMLYGNAFNNKIYKVADGAFFFETNRVGAPEYLDEKRKKIGINIACDMKSVRFGEELSYDDFIREFGHFLNVFLEKYKEYDVVFFPHIYSDLEAISDVFETMMDPFRRYRITVAPYVSGKGADEYVFGMYKQCEMILGMRFHSNVCAIAQNIPTIALSSYNKIHKLYAELGVLDRVVYVNESGFAKKLLNKAETSLTNIEMIKTNYHQLNVSIRERNKKFYSDLETWMKAILNEKKK